MCENVVGSCNVSSCSEIFGLENLTESKHFFISLVNKEEYYICIFP